MSSVNLTSWLEEIKNKAVETINVEEGGAEKPVTKKRKPVRNSRQIVSLKTEENKWQKLKHKRW